jgi:adenylate cyclase
MQQVAVESAPRLGSYLPCPTPLVREALEIQAGLPQTSRKRLGALLVEASTISPEQLRASLEAQRVDRLRRCSLFANFPRSDLVQLSAAFDEITVDAGAVFINEGELDPHLFVVASGELEVFCTDEQGDEVPIARVYPGEPVGELGYVTGGRRTASVRVLKRCELLRTEYEQFRGLLESMPRLSQAFLDVSVRRLIHTSEMFAERQQRLKRVEHSLNELTDLLDLTEITSADVGIQGLLERLVRTARSMLGAERGSLFLIDNHSGELWSRVVEGTEVKEIRIPRGEGIAGWVAEHKEVLNIKNAYQDYRFRKETDMATGYRTNSVLCAPIWSHSNVMLGVVQLINKRDGIFSAYDETLIRAFASQASIALENYNLHGKMVENHRRIALLLDLANAIGSTLDFQELIHQVVERITEALECERSSFFVVDESTRELWSMESQGEELQEIRFPMNTGLAGECATESEPIVVDDAYADPRFNPDIDRKTGFRTRNILCMPVVNRDKLTTGVIECMNKKQGGFSEEDMKLLRALSAQVSVALDNARLHAREVEMRTYLERVQGSISSAIVTLDESYGLVVCNRAAEKLLRAGNGQKESDIRKILGDGNRDILEVVEQAYRNRASANRDELMLKHSEGSTSTINMSIAPLEDAEQAFKGLVLVLDDITREKRVRSAFGQYLAPAVIEELLENPDKLKLGGEKRELTAMFTDIEGFTTLTENMDPESLVALLHEYFDMACEIVLRHGGTIDKIVGDALHVIFNAPVQVPDHAARAVRCARELAHFSQQVMADQRKRGLALGRTRIGINTGPCIVGNFGGTARFDYTAHGDAINTAARLEGANKHLGTTICVSESTMTQCGDEIAFRPIGRLLLKGKSESISVFEPLDEGSEAAAARDAYIEAFESLTSKCSDAARKFRDLALQFADDPLIRLHAQRLEAGQTGTELILESK